MKTNMQVTLCVCIQYVYAVSGSFSIFQVSKALSSNFCPQAITMKDESEEVETDRQTPDRWPEGRALFRAFLMSPGLFTHTHWSVLPLCHPNHLDCECPALPLNTNSYKSYQEPKQVRSIYNHRGKEYSLVYFVDSNRGRYLILLARGRLTQLKRFHL